MVRVMKHAALRLAMALVHRVQALHAALAVVTKHAALRLAMAPVHLVRVRHVAMLHVQVQELRAHPVRVPVLNAVQPAALHKAVATGTATATNGKKSGMNY